VTAGRADYVSARAAELGLHPDLAATLTRYTLFPVFTGLGTALAPLRELLERLGNPQRGRGTVHITGSKGKGSVAAMIAAAMTGR